MFVLRAVFNAAKAVQWPAVHQPWYKFNLATSCSGIYTRRIYMRIYLILYVEGNGTAKEL